jgi:drug/metabolite transporter (DMT)-like permease
VTSEVLFAVLLGAALHASWNAAIKSGTDKFLDTVLLAGGAALIALVLLPFLPVPAVASWGYIAAASTAQVVYYSLVAAAYRAGDMSVAYPLMRGTAPMLVALLGVLLLSDDLSLIAWIGIAFISGGVVSLSLWSLRSKATGKVVLYAVVNAAVIASYTLIDGAGVRASGNTLSYTCWITLLPAGPLLAIAALRRPNDLRRQIVRRWYLGVITGACTMASYGLALWAMTQAPIASVAALRETSIVFGMVIAAWFLGERLSTPRIMAAVGIALGAITLKLA